MLFGSARWSATIFPIPIRRCVISPTVSFRFSLAVVDGRKSYAVEGRTKVRILLDSRYIKSGVPKGVWSLYNRSSPPPFSGGRTAEHTAHEPRYGALLKQKRLIARGDQP